MQVNICPRHGKLAPQVHEKITAKVEKLGRLIDRVSTIDVTVDYNPNKADVATITVLVITELKKEFKADYASEDILGSLDQVIAKIEAQMRKFKEQMTDHR